MPVWEFHRVLSIISDLGEKCRWSKQQVDNCSHNHLQMGNSNSNEVSVHLPSFLSLNQYSLNFFCYLVEKASISWLSVFSTFLSVLIVFDCLQTKKANNLFLSRRVFCLQKSESIWNELGLELDLRRGFRWSSDMLSEHSGNERLKHWV